MAASLAKTLFDKGMIDRVICFSPSVEVANNIKRTFGKIIGCSFYGSFTAVAYSGDGEHRFRFYREHLNSTHWVHDIFNLSVHDGQF